MSDLSFEQKFGKLADAQLNEKVPSLINYRVGFQILDKSDDESMAVGVSAFIVNDVWLYIPVFFVKGDLKGFDLLYVKQRDMFVPARDNWIVMIKEQGTKGLGTGYDRGGYGPAGAHGKEQFYGPEQVQTYTNMYGQGGMGAQKYGSMGSGSIIDEETLKRMHAAAARYTPMDLGRDVPLISKQAAWTFARTLVSKPEFANALFQFYTPEELHKVASDMSSGSVPRFPEKQVDDTLVFITDRLSKEAKDLKSSEKRLLIQNGIYVQDKRVNHSQVFQNEVDDSVVQNPCYPGIYDLFLQDGEYKTMIVLFPEGHTAKPQVFRRESRDTNVGRPVAVIDLNSPSEYIKTTNRQIFCRPATNVTSANMKALQGGRKASLQAIAGLKEGSYLLLVHSANRSVETKFLGTETSLNGKTQVIVQSTAGHMYTEPNAGNVPGKVTLEFTDKPGKLVRRGSKIFVPEGVRMFHMEEDPMHERNALTFGDVETAFQVMNKEAGLCTMRVHSTGGSAEITCRGKASGLLEKVAALKHLIVGHGIQAGVAQKLLKEAGNETHGLEVFIKHAASLQDESDYGDSERPYQQGPHPQQEQSLNYEHTTQEGKALTGPQDASNNPILPEQAIQRATDAAATGIKEVFDTAVLSSLVDVADLSELRKEFISDIIRGMDKIGRILFLFYWHNDEFEDRYGRDELITLEDTLRSVFVSVGDLVLFLKEKTADNPETSESLLGSLSEDLGAQADGGV